MKFGPGLQNFGDGRARASESEALATLAIPLARSPGRNGYLSFPRASHPAGQGQPRMPGQGQASGTGLE